MLTRGQEYKDYLDKHKTEIDSMVTTACIDEEFKKISIVINEDKRIREELALRIGTSQDHLDQPNYKKSEIKNMLQGKDVYRVLCGIATGTFKKPRFSLKLEKINY